MDSILNCGDQSFAHPYAAKLRRAQMSEKRETKPAGMDDNTEGNGCRKGLTEQMQQVTWPSQSLCFIVPTNQLSDMTRDLCKSSNVNHVQSSIETLVWYLAWLCIALEWCVQSQVGGHPSTSSPSSSSHGEESDCGEKNKHVTKHISLNLYFQSI